MTQAYRAGQIDRLPFCEAFVPTELLTVGMNVMPLGAFGNTDRFEFWPPTLDSRLVLPPDPAFIHPVLDEKRFVPSRLGFGTKIDDYFVPDSVLHRELGGCAPSVVGPHILKLARQQSNPEVEAQILAMVPGLADVAG